MLNMRKTLLATAVITATLSLTACGGSGSDKKNTPVTTTPVNKAPTAILLSANAIVEDSLGAVVGSLSATDDVTTGHTFSTDDARFEIVAGQLKLKADLALNYEEASSVKVAVKVTDAGGLTFSQDLDIAVTDIENQAGVNIYQFDSAFIAGKSSVSYTGQIARHALSAEIKAYMADVSKNAELNNIQAADVAAKLNAMWSDYAAVADSDLTFLGADFPSLQTTLADISSSGKELSGKIAGNDGAKMYKDWQAQGSFVGWTDFGTQAKTPEGLIKHYFDLFVAQVTKSNNGELNQLAGSDTLLPLHVTPEGLDLIQLVQKHTLGAVMFSQGTDDYLEEGLNTEHTQDGSQSYSKLEHQFDEGFGYFGASRNYLEMTDSEIAAGNASTDLNFDGKVDLTAEYVWGNSSNAAKRDLGANGLTDFTAEAMTHFIAGRQLLAQTVGTALTTEQMAQLKVHAAAASLAWEKAIAATVIHYINDVTADIAKFGNDSMNYSDYAKHWAEMKGFALNFQFSPYSPFSDSALNPKKDTVGAAQFAQLHALLQDAPVLNAEKIEAYKADLATARNLLQQAYEFDELITNNW
ncbi:DUF4856 domain-containing protein [Pseudoalteromonas tunicata]|jgi:hypothetical protein|uniref:DUF4856 domain-containing protein n=1 Tax=Pseudoalteromonas tunicata D2 TaxID=87626 RepID=A4CD54_9GAMM|nr:DUF4856 domain-containing protein [Pseudoalteromonas tunicata]ATC94004.1 hypothetical protein PTUN_a1367 [Pseudoalteromonas tunicata]AXT29787.1 DUF4856 domain-containing protein [Pseudoalteromonas tunicata]EAR27497.1 hypothetical protein PTD2_15697 [Pseudoalteromonas tunicata D2]